MRHTSQLSSYFNARAKTYQSGNWRNLDLFPGEVNAIQSLPDNLSVALDIGSGPGKPLAALAQKARHVVALDVSVEMLQLRRHNYPVIIADAEFLPFADRSLDLAFLRMSMHYLDLTRFISQLHRVLRINSWVIVSSIFPYGPDDEVWFNERHALKGKSGAYTPTAESLIAQMAPNFEVMSRKTWFVTNFMNASLKAHQPNDRSALVRHALQAPDSIRELYQISPKDGGELSLTSNWSILVFRSKADPSQLPDLSSALIKPELIPVL